MARSDTLPHRRRLKSKGTTTNPHHFINHPIHPESYQESQWQPIDSEIQEKLINFFGILESARNLIELNSDNDGVFLQSFEEILDDLVSAFTKCIGDKEAQRNLLTNAEKGLQKAAADSIENRASKTFSAVRTRLKKLRFYRKLAFYSIMDEEEINSCKRRFESHLQRGQQMKDKNWMLSIDEFEKAYKEADSLKKSLPRTNEISYRFLTLVISLTSLLIAILSLLFSHG